MRPQQLVTVRAGALQRLAELPRRCVVTGRSENVSLTGVTFRWFDFDPLGLMFGKLRFEHSSVRIYLPLANSARRTWLLAKLFPVLFAISVVALVGLALSGSLGVSPLLACMGGALLLGPGLLASVVASNYVRWRMVRLEPLDPHGLHYEVGLADRGMARACQQLIAFSALR